MIEMWMMILGFVLIILGMISQIITMILEKKLAMKKNRIPAVLIFLGILIVMYWFHTTVQDVLLLLATIPFILYFGSVLYITVVAKVENDGVRNGERRRR